ncbi:uncharacterized protein [Chelonus insularis]|uniref:uncharacterized protein n=1 Tax=Chelonus insularis TaxID=460826 RepID=UPI001588BB5C|nr:uncharacterized protein LOC118074493 [Chelonus insularis]XP_034951623.1 uncharacterized protein LOC118074493 [Chelonus insularis]
MEKSLLSVKPTLVRRVSDLFKDGNNNGSQLLFNNTSMQKLRHCCQNLGHFPYLFHSFSNSKSSNGHRLHLNLLIDRICERIFTLYTNNLRQAISCRFSTESHQKSSVSQTANDENSCNKILEVQKICRNHFQVKHEKQENSILLRLAIYVVPVILLSQLMGLISLIFIGKYTPGFLFLLSALLFLGYISMKIFLYQNFILYDKNFGKRKLE